MQDKCRSCGRLDCRPESCSGSFARQSMPEDGGMEKVRDCRDCKNYSRNWGLNYCDIPIPPCFDMSEMAMVHQGDFVHGRTVYAESACAHFAPGKHPTRQRFEEASPQIAAAARRHVKTIVEKTEQFTVTTLP